MNIELDSTIPVMKGVRETAAAFGIAEHHARQLALSGKVKAVRTGRKGKILINQSSVADYFNSSSLTDNEPAPVDGLKPIPVKL